MLESQPTPIEDPPSTGQYPILYANPTAPYGPPHYNTTVCSLKTRLNMFRNGTVRQDIHHAACPVIHGRKISKCTVFSDFVFAWLCSRNSNYLNRFTKVFFLVLFYLTDFRLFCSIEFVDTVQ